MSDDDNTYEMLFRYTRPLSAALGFRDLLTLLHSDRVSSLAEMIGKRLGLNRAELSALKVSATFHDIGKIGIPDHILLKPDSFDAMEWETMKRHAEFGEQIIISSGLNGAEDVAASVRHHHEHYDGSGYPDGLSGDNIPISSRIMALADSYDAMAVTRSYHHARPHPEIMAIMHEECGEKFDPRLFDIFCESIEASPLKAA